MKVAKYISGAVVKTRSGACRVKKWRRLCPLDCGVPRQVCVRGRKRAMDRQPANLQIGARAGRPPAKCIIGTSHSAFIVKAREMSFVLSSLHFKTIEDRTILSSSGTKSSQDLSRWPMPVTPIPCRPVAADHSRAAHRIALRRKRPKVSCACHRCK